MIYKLELKNKKVGNFKPKEWADYTKYLVLPFTDTMTLDDSLDSATVDLRGLGKTRIKNYTKVRITKDTHSQTYLVANDLITEVVGTGKYNHKLTLIEETKILEKFVVDSCTVTQPLYKDYYSLRKEEEPTTEGYSYDFLEGKNLAKYYDIYNAGTLLKIIKPAKLSDTDTSDAMYPYMISGVGTVYKTILRIKNNGTLIYESKEDLAGDYNLKLTSGTYEVQYELRYTQVGGNSIGYANFVISAVPDITGIKTISVTDTVNRLLSICETKRKGESARFSFNTAQATKFSEMKCPEFSFTRSTLRECLDQVAGAYNSITRLEDDVVYFDEFKETPLLEVYPFKSREERFKELSFISNQSTQDIEQYCSEIDTIASNLVKTNDNGLQSIMSPFNGAYKTVRAENVAVRINEDSAIIQTEYPIERLNRVLVGGFKTSDGQVHYGQYDITKFVYELNSYNTLSSVHGVYPYSKGYALYYEQGGTAIKGLNFQLPNAISDIFKKPAIVNILEKATGLSIQNIFNVQSFTQILFRVEYVPIVTARINQTKTDVREYEDKITSIYNQSANKIDAYAYGENLKGAVARLGNIELTKTYIFKNYTDWAMDRDVLAEQIDGYCISAVSTENLKGYIKATYYLTRNFNRRNKYIGIKNNQRMWEVSEKQVQNRYIVWNDYCVIGDNFMNSDVYNLDEVEVDGGLFTDYGVNSFAHIFDGTLSMKITGARVWSADNSGEWISKVLLPVVGSGIGNSMVITFEFKDNYSAGDTSLEGATATGNEYYRVQGNIPYGDYFGNVDTLYIDYFDEYEVTNNYDTMKLVADSLPSDTTEGAMNEIYIHGTAVEVKKDNRERISFTYQMNFVSGWNDLIIGSALARLNPLIGLDSETKEPAKLVLFQAPINKFADDVTDLNKTTQKIFKPIEDYAVNYGKIRRITFTDFTIENASSYKGWGIIKTVNGRDYLLLGQNFTATGEYTIKFPTFNFLHDWGQINNLLNYDKFI